MAEEIILLDWNRIAEIAIKARYDLNLTQQDVSIAANVSKPLIVNFEKGRTNITIDNILKILNALHLEGDNNDLILMKWKTFVRIATYRRYDLIISKPKLAELSGVCVNVIIDFEKGHSHMGLNRIIAILRVLKLTKSEMVGEKDNIGKRKKRVH